MPQDSRSVKQDLNLVQRDLYAKAAMADDATAFGLVQWRTLKNPMRGYLEDPERNPGYDLEVHHVLPKRYARVLYRRIYNTNQDPPDTWLDSMPGVVLPRTKHVGSVTTPGKAAIHKLIDAEFSDGSNLDDVPTEELLAKISSAYTKLNNEYGDADGIDYNQVWSLGDRWIRSFNTP